MGVQTNITPTDQLERDQALDIKKSFIVQAPAGSGKTGLLTLRFLRLLSVCEQPEQVLAITFTRKAASEMRDRIINTLWWAAEYIGNSTSIKNNYDALRLRIAKAVLSRDQELKWQLLNNPSRLRVQTIDSFCFYLANRLPVLSQIGGNPNVSTDVELCFRDAIANTLLQLESDSALSSDVERVLSQLDNDIARIERLLIGLLQSRDQWLPYTLELGNSGDEAKKYLQGCLNELIVESIDEAREALKPYSHDLIELVNFSVMNLQQNKPPNYPNFISLDSLPESTFHALSDWQIIIELLTTKKGTWRRVVNKNIGFPTGDETDSDHQALCKLHKQQFAKLNQSLVSNDDLLESISFLRLLPDSPLDDNQWSFLTALTRVLVHLSGELLFSFRKYRKVDHTETGAAARSSLGTEENPTDITLALDHKINHILVDEFQDTSKLQLEILQQITSGWEPGDHRSLFLVGDAMQSCYGFRNANVGIYLNVQKHGLPQVSLRKLQLSANFRSDSGVVDWINRHFSTAFPAQVNISRGAVPYTSSEAVKPEYLSTAITTEIICYNEEDRSIANNEEARKIIDHIKALKNNAPGESIAILVRNRAHLNAIIPALTEHNIEWQSTDIDRMQALQSIEDLLSLTKALLSPADRLSWLALLRAPWLGLRTSDLLVIAKKASEKSVWDTLQHLDHLVSLSKDARERLPHFIEAIGYGMQYRYRISLRALIETTWCLLRGAATLASEREITSARHYFILLSEHEVAGGLGNIAQFQEQVFSAFIPPSIQHERPTEGIPIQLLTMHKAKGLEFDHIVAPGLAKLTRSNNNPLLEWHERVNSQGQARLFMAALTETGEEEDKLYSLLRHEKNYKAFLENTRLLYIAITRARKSAKLFATVGVNQKQELQIPSSSLLSRIWREIQSEAHKGINSLQVHSADLLASKCNSKDNSTRLGVPLPTLITRFTKSPVFEPKERLQLRQQLPNAKTDLTLTQESSQKEGILNAAIGSLIHSALEDYSNSNDKENFLSNLESQKAYWKLLLHNKATSKLELTESLSFIAKTLEKLLHDNGLKWIFSHDYTECHSEYPITSISLGKIHEHIIDRTLVDNHGVRWIIDYKTGIPVNEEEADFIIKQKVAHESQLYRYRSLFAELENRKTKTAILFTSIQKLIEV